MRFQAPRGLGASNVDVSPTSTSLRHGCLSDVDVSNVDVSNVNVSDVDVSNVDVSDVDVSDVDVSNVDVSDVDGSRRLPEPPGGSGSLQKLLGASKGDSLGPKNVEKHFKINHKIGREPTK